LAFGFGGPSGPSASGGSDNFNRGDSANDLTTSSSGHAWTNNGGTWGVASNQAAPSTADAGDGDTIATMDAGLANGTFSITIAVVPEAAEYVGVVFRLTDQENNLRVIVGGTGDPTMYVQKE
jgi:hypothetical protein